MMKIQGGVDFEGSVCKQSHDPKDVRLAGIVSAGEQIYLLKRGYVLRVWAKAAKATHTKTYHAYLPREQARTLM
jgi:hypothetical protein